MLSSSYATIKEDRAQSIKRREREWYLYAGAGVLLYVSLLALARIWLNSGEDSSSAIKILMIPLIIPVFLRGKMNRVSQDVSAVLRVSFGETAVSYPLRYELLLSLGGPSNGALAQTFRRLQLFWATSSLYVLSSVLAILINFIITR